MNKNELYDIMSERQSTKSLYRYVTIVIKIRGQQIRCIPLGS